MELPALRDTHQFVALVVAARRAHIHVEEGARAPVETEFRHNQAGECAVIHESTLPLVEALRNAPALFHLTRRVSHSLPVHIPTRSSQSA